MTAQNLATSLKAEKLTVIVDLDQEQGLSKSEKSMIIASSRGALSLANGLNLNLNLYRKVDYKPPKKARTTPPKPMDNVQIEVQPDGHSISITMDTRQDFGQSTSGKSIIIASTRGNKQLFPKEYPDIMLGLSLYKKA